MLTEQEIADMHAFVTELEERSMACDIFTLSRLATATGEEWETLVREYLAQWKRSPPFHNNESIMKMPWDYALPPRGPAMPHLTLDDVPHSVFEALCGVLDEESCSFELLVLTAKQAGLELQTERLVEQWLEKQKAGDFIELVEDRWQIRGCSDTSSEKL